VSGAQAAAAAGLAERAWAAPDDGSAVGSPFIKRPASEAPQRPRMHPDHVRDPGVLELPIGAELVDSGRGDAKSAGHLADREQSLQWNGQCALEL
jgi:hypothetical protein